MPPVRRTGTSPGGEAYARPIYDLKRYVHGITKVGRNAEAFLENAAGMRWYKTLSGGTHGILKVETSQDLNSLPLEGKVPTEWGNEVES